MIQKNQLQSAMLIISVFALVGIVLTGLNIEELSSVPKKESAPQISRGEGRPEAPAPASRA